MKRRKRILIIDGEFSCRSLLIQTLRKLGHDCKEAADSSEGLNHALDEDLDLVISECVMPNLSGIELVRVIKKFKSAMPVILISEQRTSSTVQAAFREGAYDFVFKPFNEDELEVAVSRALERSGLARENDQYKHTLESRVAGQTERIRALTLGSIIALANALEAKDGYTNGHSKRVAEYSILIAQQLELGEEFQERVRIAGQLHDLGKIGLRESILNKAGQLTDEEYEAVRQHPIVGSNILLPVVIDACIICGVRHHHERYDGSGYPERLAGEKIPYEARILAVADTYDAMTTNRAYRRSLGYEKAMAEIKHYSGKQFDPVVAYAFTRTPRKKIDKVLLSAPVVEQWSIAIGDQVSNK